MSVTPHLPKVLAALLLLGIVLGVGYFNSSIVNFDSLQVGTKVPVVEGYQLIGVTTEGRYVGRLHTMYCKHKTTGLVQTCTNGVLGTKVTPPAGYEILTVSSDGNVTFYCLNKRDGHTYVCHPTIF